MIRPKQLSLVSLFLFGVASAGLANERIHYAIKVKGKVIGYAVVDAVDLGKKSKHIQLRSTTVLKMTLLGQPRITKLVSTTDYIRGTDTPVRYRLKTHVNQVVQNVHCDLQPGKAKRWQFREGDKRGKANEIELPKSFSILGGNNFGHWQRLSANVSKRAKPTLSVNVFLPDGGQKTNFKFRQGARKSLQIRGKATSCIPYYVTGGIVLWHDSQTRQFVRMDLPAQQTTIELADVNVVKMFQRAEAMEVLADRFAKSNVIFDDFMKVTHVQAEIDVTVQGTVNAAVLTTPIQKFAGKQMQSRVMGTISVTSKRYNGQGAPRFPFRGKERESLQPYLQPSLYIESTHPTIVTKSRELTTGAKDSWQATARVARWVQKEVAYTIADTPSARLALEKRKGDCGPHSTLTVAMLRAAGIPARLVGGLLYTPLMGGTFGQHAWVEVYMGKAGWIAVDPTTGEIEQLSAVHLKLFEGVGGVLPKAVKVVKYEPLNRPVAPTKPRLAKKVPWKTGKEYTFRYRLKGKDIGTETFKVKKLKGSKPNHYRYESNLKLQVRVTKVQSKTTFDVAANGHPISMTRIYTSPKAKVSFSIEKGKAKIKRNTLFGFTRTVDLPKNVLFFDNNLMASFAAICCQLDFKLGESQKISTLHPSSNSIIGLTLVTATKMEEVGDQPCYKVNVLEIKNTFWITKDGRFVKAQQNPLVIELLR